MGSGEKKKRYGVRNSKLQQLQIKKLGKLPIAQIPIEMNGLHPRNVAKQL